MATAVLQSLGLGPPNPAAYSDASAVASQQTAAIGGLQSTVASVGTALSFAKTSGVSSSTLDNLQDLSTRGNTLMTQASTMNPATLATKTAALQSELMVSQFNALNEQYQKTLTDTKAIAATIDTRVKVVRADSTTSPGLLSQYETLLIDVNNSVKLLLASPPAYTVTPSSGSSGTGGSVSSYVVPTVPDADEYQSRLDDLDGLKEKEQGSGYTFSRIWRIFKHWCYVYLYKSLLVMFFISSFIFGGIVTSNAYVSSDPMYLPNRLFYFFYGALAFPISIISACVKPPFWVAGIFPAYVRSAPVPTPVPTIQSGGLFSLSTLTSAKVPTVPKIFTVPTIPTVSSTNPIGILSMGVTEKLTTAGVLPTTAVPSVSIAPANPTGVGVAAAATPRVPAGTPFIESGTAILKPGSYDLFSYVLVDSNNPPPYQVAGKKTLWYVALAHATGLIGFGVSYGFLSKISAGLN
jgi:hypothetical protein